MTQLKVGIIGLGRAGIKMHMAELEKKQDMFKVVAGCDIAADRREAAEKALPGITLYDDYKLMILDPNIDIIAVATRSLDHVQHSIDALNAGKYVICEKPVTDRVTEFDRLLEASYKHPNKLFIRHNRRFEPAFNHIQEIIASGKLGNVFEVKLRRNSYQWRQDWQTIKEFGGGQLLNWGPHIVDHSLQFLESPVESIWSSLKLVAALGDAEDHLKIIFTGKNKRIVDMEISGGCSISDPVYLIHGTRGSLLSQDEKTIKLKYLKETSNPPTCGSNPGNPPLEGGFGGQVNPEWIEEEIPVAPANLEDTTKQYDHVYDAIVKGIPYRVKLEEAREVVRVIEEVKKTAIDVMK